MIVVVHGPAACGKTRNSEQLRRHFGCERIIDDWSANQWRSPGSPMLQQNDLILTTEKPKRIFAAKSLRALNFTVMTFDTALRESRKSADALHDANDWFRSRIILGSGDWTPTTDVYADYRGFAETAGECAGQILSPIAFAERMKRWIGVAPSMMTIRRLHHAPHSARCWPCELRPPASVATAAN